jgi:hypothetical protein
MTEAACILQAALFRSQGSVRPHLEIEDRSPAEKRAADDRSCDFSASSMPEPLALHVHEHSPERTILDRKANGFGGLGH